MMGDPVRCLPKVVHPDVAALKLQHNPTNIAERVFEDLRTAPHVYLLPEYEDAESEREVLEDFWPELFAAMLNCWLTDEQQWPKNRTHQMFSGSNSRCVRWSRICLWMKSWSNSTRAGHAAIPDSRRPDIRIGRDHRTVSACLIVDGVVADGARRAPWTALDNEGSHTAAARRRWRSHDSRGPAAAAAGPARVGRLTHDPRPEGLDLGPLPGRHRGDEAAAFGRLGLAGEEGDQRLVVQLPRDQHRAADGGADAVHRGLHHHAVEAETRGPTRSGGGAERL